MRRFIHAVTIAGALTPAIAVAQTAPSTGTAPTGQGAAATGAPSTGTDGTNPNDPRRRTTTPTTTTTTTPATTSGTSAGATTGTAPIAIDAAPPAATTSQPAPSGTTGSTNTAPPGGPPSEPATTGTVPTTTGTPGQLNDRTTPAPAARPAAPAPLFWRGTTFIMDTSTSFETLFPGSQLSPDPSIQTWLSIRPRIALPRPLHQFSVRARLDATYEWFNDDSSTRLHEWVLGDLWTDVVFTGIPRFLGIATSVGLRFQWPTSLTSRLRGNYFNLALSLGANRTFELGRAGELSVGLAFVGTRPVAPNTTTAVVGNGYNCQAFDGTPIVCVGLGTMNSAFSLATSLSLAYNPPVPGLSFSALGLIVDQWRQNTPDVTLRDRMGGTVTVDRSPLDQRFAQSTFVSFAVDYEVQKWLSLSLSYWVSRSVLNPDGSYGNPFWAPGGSTRMSFTVTVPIDEVYAAISGRNVRQTGTGGGANTRGITRNETRPRVRSVANDMARMIREQNAANGFF